MSTDIKSKYRPKSQPKIKLNDQSKAQSKAQPKAQSKARPKAQPKVQPETPTLKRYIGGKETSILLGVHQRTLYQWDSKGIIETIRTPGGKRLYNVQSFLHAKEQNIKALTSEETENLGVNNINFNEKLNVSYARVSSISQKNDLERQKKMINEMYPDHKLIVDIGSGINFERPGFRKIINLAIAGQINELIIAYEDRFTRFGFKFFEDLIKDYSSGKIIVINKKYNLEPEEELIKDVMQIMNVYVAKMNGLRKYKKQNKIDNVN